MNISTALRKISTLTVAELDHCVMRIDIDIVNYQYASLNYNEKNRSTYAVPYLQRLQDQKQQFIDELEKRRSTK